MRYVFRRHLFLLIGVCTLGLFFLVSTLDRVGKIEAAQMLAGPMRVLIVPMYVVWLLLTMAHVAIAGPLGLPGPIAVVASGITFIAGLAPYALVDYVIDRFRGAANRNKTVKRDTQV